MNNWEHTQDVFAGTGIPIISTGRPYLGAALGSAQFVQDHTAHCVEQQIESLNRFALTQPHASNSTFIHGISSKWTFFLHTTPGIAESFLPLKQVVRHHFLVPHSPNDVEGHCLYSLPIWEALVFNPYEIAPATYQFS